MEYLMTYGWAILVVMVVGVALWQMGIFNNLSETVSRCNDFENIKCFDPSVQYKEGGAYTATFTNALGQAINIKSVTAEEDCVYSTNDTALIGGIGDVLVQPGGTIQFSCTPAASKSPYSRRLA